MEAAEVSSIGIAESVILGIVQGIGEFLPVSSSGHLALAHYFLGVEEAPLFFDVMLHVGTLMAVLAFYRKSLFQFSARAAVKDRDADQGQGNAGENSTDLPPENFRLLSPWFAFLLLITTLPAVGAYLVFKPGDETTSWRAAVGNMREYSGQRPRTVAMFLSITGVVLLIGSRMTGGTIDAGQMTVRQALWIGIAQAFSAMCPGVSRSGMTVTAGLMQGLRPNWAVHFSLLASIPAILGALVVKAKDLDSSWLTSQNMLATAIGTMVAGLVGWFAIGLLITVVQRGRWALFSPYLWAVAIATYIATI